MSASEIISGNTRHNLGAGGVDAGPTSVGHGWAKGPRRAPAVYSAVFKVAQFWDGRAADLEAQAKGPVQASVEMNATPEHVVKTMSSMPEYVEMFEKAFPRDTAPVSFDNFAKASEAFEATLITPAAPFDRYLEGDANALSDQQKAGLELFMDKGCSSLPQRHQRRRRSLLPVRRRREARRRHPAGGRQRPLQRQQDRERRIRVPRRAAA